MKQIELTILMPCLNEEATVAICIQKAKKFLEENGVCGEILIVDNGSVDNSVSMALENGARVIKIKKIGYGNALIYGSENAKGKYTIMGDCDDSYNFLELMPILAELRNGYELVIGNRYKGKMEKHAMKLSHKYIGTPIISFIGKILHKIEVNDFNCGLRGYITEKINSLNCKCEGMEYATEMLIKARKNNLKIKEIPINFYKDGRKRKSHLRTIPDGMRHFKILFNSF